MGGPGFVPAAYTANNLNQYTSISSSAPSATPCEAFVPQFDLDGNQTLVKTSTGVWQVAYNGENRPVSWTCGTTNIVMSFDRMGRRVQYVESVDGVTNSHVTFVYDGYLQIANTDAVAETERRFVWDPTEPVATRPLVFYSDADQPHYYTHDGNKNVSDIIDSTQTAVAHYEYAPFGETVYSSGALSLANPYRFSSEYADDTLGLVYYNYRHYNPLIGRWTGRDWLYERNPYLLLDNYMCYGTDVLGLLSPGQGRVGPPVLGGNIPMINFNALPKEYFVESFWGMVGGAVKKYDALRLKPSGTVYEDAKRTIEREFLPIVIERFVYWDSCSIKSNEPFRAKESIRFGGRLFSNPFSSDWGPFTEGFWTLGNATVDFSILSSELKAEQRDMCFGPSRSGCYCVISGTVHYSATLVDCFDFYPNRDWLGSPSEFAYNSLATPFSLGFNVFLEATSPKVESTFSGTLKVWEARLR